MSNKHFTAIIFSIAIVLSAIFLGKSYEKKYHSNGKITVTGLGKQDFSSDLIVWSAQYSVQAIDVKQAYIELKKQKEIIQNYLLSKGASKQNIIFSAVSSSKNYKRNYSKNGDFIGKLFTGYTLSQEVEIQSGEVSKIETISRNITELLNQGINLYSESPRYYYTKLANLKVEMISKATEDARIRAEKIAKNSGGKLGKLLSAKMGVFQITGQNSNENYSWGGTYNTSSKEKTASITMKLVYKTK